MKNPRAFEQFTSCAFVKALITLLFLFSLMIPVAANSAEVIGSVKVAWDPNDEPGVVGYRVHYGSESRAYTQVIDIGSATEFEIPGLIKDRRYFCSVTAYNTYGMDSDFAEELLVVYTPPVLGQEFRIDGMTFGADNLMTFEVSGMIGTTVEVWASPDLANWDLIDTLTDVIGPLTIRDTAAAGQLQRFYQLRTP